MKPTNTKERTQAKVRFLLFLVVTMALVIAAIFFDYQIPEKENKLLRTNMKKNNELLAAEEAFANQMRSVKGLLDSMDIEGVNADYIEQIISKKLANMQMDAESDDTFRREMYSNIIQTYLELKNAKSSLLRMEGSMSDLNDYSDLVERYKEDLQQVQRDLDNCRRMLNN